LTRAGNQPTTIDVTMNIDGHVILDAERDALRHIDDLLG
jgi:hypothetical protein